MKRRMKILGASVRAHRHFLGLSVEQLARRAHLHKNAIWVIEQGHGNPCYSTLLALARVLKCTFEISP
jgi:transcriptional regulator with XRE-family HTH domain